MPCRIPAIRRERHARVLQMTRVLPLRSPEGSFATVANLDVRLAYIRDQQALTFIPSGC
jgi:hypothetical protein